MYAADVRAVQEDNQNGQAQGDQEKPNCLNMKIDGEEYVSKTVKVDQFNLQALIVREKHDTNDIKGLKMSFKRGYSTDRWDAMLTFENGQTTVRSNKFFDRMPDEPLLLECKMGVLQHMVHKERDFTVPDEYSDIMITCDGKEFQVSRAFVSSWSEFLRGLFTSDMREASDNKYECVFLKHEEKNAFLNFIHPMTGLRVYYEILPTLLYTADALLAPRVTFLLKFLLRDYDDRRQHLLATELSVGFLHSSYRNQEKYAMFSEDTRKFCKQRLDELMRREGEAEKKKEKKEGEGEEQREEEESDSDSVSYTDSDEE